MQDSVNCLVTWTIFQTDDGISLLKLFERMKAGRIAFIVPSRELAYSNIEKIFIGKSKETLTVIDHSIHLNEVLNAFSQFIKYNVVCSLMATLSSGVTSMVQPNLYTVLMQNSVRLSAAARKPLPYLLPKKNNKDKLFNAVVGFLEKTDNMGEWWKHPWYSFCSYTLQCSVVH